MADVIGLDFLHKITAALAGGGLVRPITHIAFGDGGHDPLDDSVRVPSNEADGLAHELLRKGILALTRPDLRTVTITGRVLGTELNGETLSEVACFDSDGTVVGIRTFAPRSKVAGNAMDFTLTFRF